MEILSSNFIFDLIFPNELRPFKPEPLNNLIKSFLINHRCDERLK